MPISRGAPSSEGFAIGISLVAFSGAAEIRGFAAEVERRYQRRAFFELSYATTAAGLDELGFLKGRVFSSHAPCPAAELFPNLGSRDPAVAAESLQAIRRSAVTAAAFGAELLVLHPGYATDAGVSSDSRRRLACLASCRAPEELSWLWLQQGSVCRPGYCRSPEYRAHLETAMGNLPEAASLCAREGVRLAVENLNPRLTYLFQLPGELVELAGDVPELALCVDLGHLWVSSRVHGFGFREGLEELLGTGRVASVHVHDNASTLGPPPVLADDHAAIGSGRVPIRQALGLLAAAGVSRLIIESAQCPMDNFARLLRLVSEAEGHR